MMRKFQLARPSSDSAAIQSAIGSSGKPSLRLSHHLKNAACWIAASDQPRVAASGLVAGASGVSFGRLTRADFLAAGSFLVSFLGSAAWATGADLVAALVVRGVTGFFAPDPVAVLPVLPVFWDFAFSFMISLVVSRSISSKFRTSPHFAHFFAELVIDLA